jgi:anaerobic selenocysteine-containing dehydrogenase
MNYNGVVNTACDLCSQYCGVLVHIKDGKVTSVAGNPDSPINKGMLCLKGKASLEYLYHPDRLKRPLRRIDERGNGKWEEISWDEALDCVAREFIKARDKDGAESVAVIRGARRGLQDDYMTRFANAFGTPNIVSASYVCSVPRKTASLLTCGYNTPCPDYEYPPACLVVWAANLPEAAFGDYIKATEALKKGTKLMVIDPIRTELAKKANLWLQLRPGSDLALALAMINVIVKQELFDKAFVRDWTVGFDQLKAHVQSYSPEKAEEITWVPAGKIIEAARFYALNKPASIRWGNGIDQGVNSFQTARAISILRAITGNLGVPGGELKWSRLAWPTASGPQMSLQNNIAMDKRQRRLGAGHMLPIMFFALPQLITRAILEESSPPTHVIYVQSSNPILTQSHAQETYAAFKKVDFVVVADMFMTPTAALADIVLPVGGTYLEFDSLCESSYYPIVQVQQKVAQIGECWPDYKILSELAKKLGLGNYFWDSEEECLNAILKPTGLTFEDFRKIGILSCTKQYRGYEVGGFETPSGKVEIYSKRLKEWGFDPLPAYYEPTETPISAPEVVKDYPLVFTNWKSLAYRHSQGRQISSLRKSHPDPVVAIHPETASKLGIRDGDWVYIETKRGRIKQKATLISSVDPRVVAIDYGWWFPEKGQSELYGWKESNVNVLTDNKPPYNREMGSTSLRGGLCKVYKV